MSPDTPANPSQGKPDEDQELAAQQSAEALAQQESAQAASGQPAPVPATVDVPEEAAVTPGEPEAEGTAAAETGIDKKAAEALTPKRTKREGRPGAQPARRKQRPDAAGVLVRAQAKYVRTSARKARLVCDHIRGKDVEQARAILAFTPRGAAEAWSKLLESAVANAENNHELVGDELRIASVHADEGPTLKRFRPRAMGRATKIRKRTSHLTITLTPKD